MTWHIRKSIRRRVLRLNLAIVDRTGDYIQPAILITVGTGIVFAALAFGIGSANDVAGWILSILIATVIIFIQRRSMRHNVILTELTAGYIMSGDREFLDSLLGKLIGGRWKRYEARPGNLLYGALSTVADDGTYEQKRRIAEALPALAQINRSQTLPLMESMRDDWDNRWKSDIRRRVVEALTISVKTAQPVLIDVARDREVAPLLRLRDDDEIYTAMAVAETIGGWRTKDPMLRSQVETRFFADADRLYSADEKASLTALIEMIQLATQGPQTVLARVSYYLESPVLMVRIAAGRVLALYVETDDRMCMGLIETVAQDQHRYVRRCAARERVVKFLLRKASRGPLKARATALLERLLLDSDDIIAVTVFDIFETWTRGSGAQLSEACTFIQNHRTGPPELINRVRRAQASLQQES